MHETIPQITSASRLIEDLLSNVVALSKPASISTVDGMTRVAYTRGRIAVVLEMDPEKDVRFLFAGCRENEEIVSVIEASGKIVIETPNETYPIDKELQGNLYNGIILHFKKALKSL